MKKGEVSGLLERQSWLVWGLLRRPDSSLAIECLVRCLISELVGLFLQQVGPEERQEPLWY
jgi:hypothetical protein